jgi:acylaminoacyl-peptidase
MRWQPAGHLVPQVKPCGGASSLMPRYLQVWEKNRKLKSFNLSALEKHGPVYEDGEAPGW